MKMTLKDTAVETTETIEYRKSFVPSWVCSQAQRRSRDSGIGADSSGRISGLRSGLSALGPDSPRRKQRLTTWRGERIPRLSGPPPRYRTDRDEYLPRDAAW